MAGQKWVYTFGDGKAEGEAGMKNLLGGKGANLAEMSNLGLPVPPGFTITTEVCTWYYDNGKNFPAELDAEVKAALAGMARLTGKTFGDPANPLLVSVRSGARASMPGMMDTVLNLGLNDVTVEAVAKASGDARFAYDSYRRFITMYSNVVLDIDHGHFEEALEDYKERKGLHLDTDLSADDWKVLVGKYKEIVKKELGSDFPQDPQQQLWGAVGAVFSSWMNARAIKYRELNSIPASWGTAVNVQSMVFGNMGETSATGVAFTRNPSTGENALYGEFLINAQGEDVVAGIRTPQDITEAAKIAAKSDKPSMEKAMPEAYAELCRIYGILEKHYRDMQDMEFTIQEGKLWMLQTRSGKRTAKAALRIAVELAREGLITEKEAVGRVEPGALDQLLHPTIDTKAERRVLTAGLPASPGAAAGEIVFTSEAAEAGKKAGKKVILVRVETSPEDIHGMHAAEGILTTRGGMTSHAAVVARGMGKPCVSGAGQIRVDYAKGTMTVGPTTLKAGDFVTIDGSNGQVLLGEVKMQQPELSGDFRTLMGWADKVRPPQDPRQCRDAARRQGGARVRRRGHRPLPHRAHVLRCRPHPCRPRDDPGRGREGSPRRSCQAPADAAPGLRRALHHHAGPAGHDPPARSAAARVPAAYRRGDRRGRGGDGHDRRQAEAPSHRAARVQPDARFPRCAPRGRLSRDRRDAGAGDLRGGRDRRQGDRPPRHSGGHGPARHGCA